MNRAKKQKSGRRDIENLLLFVRTKNPDQTYNRRLLYVPDGDCVGVHTAVTSMRPSATRDTISLVSRFSSKVGVASLSHEAQTTAWSEFNPDVVHVCHENDGNVYIIQHDQKNANEEVSLFFSDQKPFELATRVINMLELQKLFTHYKIDADARKLNQSQTRLSGLENECKNLEGNLMSKLLSIVSDLENPEESQRQRLSSISCTASDFPSISGIWQENQFVYVRTGLDENTSPERTALHCNLRKNAHLVSTWFGFFHDVGGPVTEYCFVVNLDHHPRKASLRS